MAKDFATALAASFRMAFVFVMVSVSPGDEFLDFGTAPVALVTGDTVRTVIHFFSFQNYISNFTKEKLKMDKVVKAIW